MTAQELMQNVRDAGGEIWATGDKLRYRIPTTTAAGLIPAMRELKPELLQLLRQDPDYWAMTFALWAQIAYVYQPRRFGEFSSLWIAFCEWCADRGASCGPSRATFDQLLRRSDFLLADGIVSALILRPTTKGRRRR